MRTLVETSHEYELICFVAAFCAVVMSSYLFTVKLSDLLRVRREGQNGPVLFMATDKIRHQGFTLAVSMGMLMLAVSAVNNPAPPQPQTLNFILGTAVFAMGIVVDGLFTYRRRIKLAELVGRYSGQLGGTRKTDPKP